MIKSNFHTHTVYCDGTNTPEQMVEKAIELGFLSLGFSAHSPMKFESEWTISNEKLPLYFEKIELLKEKYKSQIEIYNGIELDSDSIDLSKYNFDYIIASVHQIHKNGKTYSIDFSKEELKRCVENEFGSDFIKMAQQYYDTFSRFIIEVKPDIVGHFDLIEKFNENGELFSNNTSEYKSLIEKTVIKITKSNPRQIFEVNTGAMFRCGNKMPYPSSCIMKVLKENGCRIIINSDAHCTDALNYGFDEALRYCKNCGFNEVYTLLGGNFVKYLI